MSGFTHARRCWALFLPLAAALIGAAAVAPARAAQFELGAAPGSADYTVGCMFPLSGRSANYGRDSIAAIRMALSEIAQAPAERGLPRLRVLVEDDRSKASYAHRIAEDFVSRDKARFLCGVVSSGVAQAVTRVARERKVIMIGTDHASSRLTLEDFHQHYFRVTNDIYASMAAGARHLAKLQQRNGWRRLVFIGPDYDYGHVAWQDLKSNLDRLGVKYELGGQFWPKLYEPDYSTYLAAIARSKPDIVVTALWGGDFIAFIKQAQSAGQLGRIPLANFDTGGNYDVLESFGDNAPPNLILSARHHNNWPDTARNRRFVADFHAATGRYPTYAAEGAYAGIQFIAHAAAKAGPRASTAQLVAALEGLCLPLPEDPEGHTSCIDPTTHQVAQAQAVGEVVPGSDFPPAKVMLGRWQIYPAADLKPPPDVVRQRRRATPP